MPNGSIQLSYNTTALADGTQGGGVVESLKINGSVMIQDGKYIDAAWQVFLDRGNKMNTIEATVFTGHGSRVTALAFLAGIRGAIPGVADLVITLADGIETLMITAAEAAWDTTSGAAMGQSSRVTYKIRAGELAVAIDGHTSRIDGGTFGAAPGTPGVDGGSFADSRPGSPVISGGSF